MLCIGDLERHGLRPENGEVLVTGAAGGVGGTAVAILTKLGYTVAASTGREDTHEYLRSSRRAHHHRPHSPRHAT